MDRTINNNQGFTLVEIMIVVVIAAILITIGIFRFNEINQRSIIADDMHRLSTFIKDKKLRAFTVKQNIGFTLNAAGTILTATLDPAGAATVDGTITMQNPVAITGGPLAISSRGIFTGLGNIHLAVVNNQAAYSCVVMTSTRVRLGEWNGVNCNAK